MQMTTILIAGIICFIIITFMVRAPGKAMRMAGNTAVRIVIGVLFLFFINVFGGNFGLHIPINLFTVAISSILGVFGVLSLFFIHLILL